MKSITQFIQEGFKLNKNYKRPYNYYPKTIDDLDTLVNQLIKERGNEANLNDICTSEITDMSFLFYNSDFDGDISQWDVSNVTDMRCMFYRSDFTGKNGDISKWDVGNVEDMESMFENSTLCCDLSKWDVKNVKLRNYMFRGCILKNNAKKPIFRKK